jgi:FkbM family methyltransferase
MATLKNLVKYLANQALKPFNTCTVNISYLQQLVEQNQRAIDDLEMLSEMPERHGRQLLKALRVSKSQLRQDLLVLSELDFKRGGFFVEFGATNGVTFSNTYLLEKEFGWTGILAEPARGWHNDLKKNRDAHIETNCVWRDSTSTLTFNETEIGELSTIDSYSSAPGHHYQARKQGKTYQVKTISFVDLLKKFNAPSQIDYLSIDTEGSEFDILSNFNFEKYQFKIITCEHNFQPAREKIYALLSSKGYVRKFEKLSQYDDWYVKAE